MRFPPGRISASRRAKYTAPGFPFCFSSAHLTHTSHWQLHGQLDFHLVLENEKKKEKSNTITKVYKQEPRCEKHLRATGSKFPAGAVSCGLAMWTFYVAQRASGSHVRLFVFYMFTSCQLPFVAIYTSMPQFNPIQVASFAP